MNTVKQRISRSVDRSSSSEIYSPSRSRSASDSRSRSASDSRLSSQYNSKSTSLDPLYSNSGSLEVSANRETLKYNGICKTQDYYTKILGPTVDESILVGLQMLVKLGFALPNCTAPPPKYELPTPESSADIASQTESSETKSETSQTPHISEVAIGYSEETYSVDYEKSLSTPSTKSESLEPESTNESVTTLSSSIISEELITEPAKVDTELLPVPVPTEIFDDEEEEEAEEEEIIENETKEPTPNESENLKEEISIVPEEPIEEKPEEPIEEKPEEPIEEKPEEPIEEKPEEPIEETPEEPIEEIILLEKISSERIMQDELQEIVEEMPSEKTEEETVEPLSETTEEFPTTEGESANEDVTRLAPIVKTTYQKSQDDTETSEIPTVLTPVQESSVIENRNSRSKFPEKTIAATATYANHDRPELYTEDSKRTRTSIISYSFSTDHYKNDKMSDTESEIETKGSKQSRRGSTNSKQKSLSGESSASKKSKEKNNHSSVSKSERKSLEQSDSSMKKEHKNSSKQKTQIKENGSSADSKKSRDKHKRKQETIQEVTETDPSMTSMTSRTSRSSSVGSEYDTSEEKGNAKASKADKCSSTPSILKSSTSSKSKESSTDTYICACRIQADGDERKCICPTSYCPRCETKKTPLIVTCPFITTCKKTEVPRNGDRTCLCGNAIVNETQTQNPKYICESCTAEDKKLLCDCYTSTSSTGYTSGSDSCGNMQRGDCVTKSNVRYAITKITEYGKFTTFEVMKSTKKVPKFIPKSLEGVFVLKHKS